jgi:hypothetical protein
MKRRQVTYGGSRNAAPARTPGASETPFGRPSAVSIDVTARAGRDSVRVGDRVRIKGTGLYAGEAATVERLVPGVIPAATVRTEGGGTRRVRTIDLEPITSQA